MVLLCDFLNIISTLMAGHQSKNTRSNSLLKERWMFKD